MPGPLAQGPRVALRPAREDDLALVRDLRAGDRTGEMLVITLRTDDRPIGIIQYRVDEPSAGWVTIDHLALEKKSRRWGLGQDAVRLFEEEAASSRGVAHFRTTVDIQQGLLLYLWLRLGYRPAEYTYDASGSEALAMIRETGSLAIVPRPRYHSP